MINLTANEASLLGGKLNTSSRVARLCARLMNITATAVSRLRQTPRRCTGRAFDHNLHMRHEVMRHEARRLL